MRTTPVFPDLSKEDQFSSWLREQFSTAGDILCDNLQHENSHVQVTDTPISFLGCLFNLYQQSKEDSRFNLVIP